MTRLIILTIFTWLISAHSFVWADKMDSFKIYADIPDKAQVKYPHWFKSSFFNIQEDLDEARQAGKRGVIIFFSQNSCNHCQALIEATFKDKQVSKRLRKKYDVVGMDIFSDLEVTDLEGGQIPVKTYVNKYRANLTPTLLFYGVEKKLLLKIIGFYPPKKFLQVLDYLEGGHYKNLKLSQYLKKQSVVDSSAKGLIPDPLLAKSPINLSASKKSHILVIFEMSRCKACARFHQRVLKFPQVRKKIPWFTAVQLDATDEKTPIVTPSGKRTTAAKWYEALQLNYDVAIVYFDKNGKEVFRSDAETGKHRMSFTMDYVNAKGYQQEIQVQRWRRQQYLNSLK